MFEMLVQETVVRSDRQVQCGTVGKEFKWKDESSFLVFRLAIPNDVIHFLNSMTMTEKIAINK